MRPRSGFKTLGLSHCRCQGCRSHPMWIIRLGAQLWPKQPLPVKQSAICSTFVQIAVGSNVHLRALDLAVTSQRRKWISYSRSGNLLHPGGQKTWKLSILNNLKRVDWDTPKRWDGNFFARCQSYINCSICRIWILTFIHFFSPSLTPPNASRWRLL